MGKKTEYTEGDGQPTPAEQLTQDEDITVVTQLIAAIEERAEKASKDLQAIVDKREFRRTDEELEQLKLVRLYPSLSVQQSTHDNIISVDSTTIHPKAGREVTTARTITDGTVTHSVWSTPDGRAGRTPDGSVPPSFTFTLTVWRDNQHKVKSVKAKITANRAILQPETPEPAGFRLTPRRATAKTDYSSISANAEFTFTHGMTPELYNEALTVLGIKRQTGAPTRRRSTQ